MLMQERRSDHVLRHEEVLQCAIVTLANTRQETLRGFPRSDITNDADVLCSKAIVGGRPERSIGHNGRPMSKTGMEEEHGS